MKFLLHNFLFNMTDRNKRKFNFIILFLLKVVSKKSYAQTLKIKGRQVGTITVS